MISRLLHSAPRVLQAAFLLTVFGSQVFAQASSAHQALLLEVVEVNKIDLTAGFISFALTGSSAAASPLEGTTTDVSLIWTTNGYDKKITVGRTGIADGIRLRVAIDDGEGLDAVPSGEIEFQDNGSFDFLRGISKAAGSCRLRLMAIAETGQDVGNDIHLLTYTITGD